MSSDKPKRNVVRDTACPTCGKLFYKHAVRIHSPFCKGKNALPAVAGASSAESASAPLATAAAGTPSPKPSSWIF
jgi:hypothetical protein